MKVSIDWLKELVDLPISVEELVELLPLRTIGTKEVTKDFIELDMKGYNRADLLSMRGIAYEVAAITDSKVCFNEPDETDYVWSGQGLGSTPVEVTEELLSPIQCVAKIEGLKVANSTQEWVEKLIDSGMRQVNNIADVTNLVMLEYGHPLHAFDAASVKNDKIIIRRAKKNEEITTLDGKARRLDSDDIVLSDDEKALDVAGVMGGKETEVSDSTNTILLSASLFNPAMVRQTSQKLKLTSEASRRFYHGLTVRRLFQAMDAAIRKYQELGGKLISFTVVGNKEDQDIDIELRENEVDSLIGVEVGSAFIEESLTKLNFTVNQEFNDEGLKKWKVMPPYFRHDVEIEADLIEEVARMYGYENIPAKELGGLMPEIVDQSRFEFERKVREELVMIGFSEVLTYSFVPSKVIEALGLGTERMIRVANPISSETEYMRVEVWPNLVEKAIMNLKYRKALNIFEIGKRYKALNGAVSEIKVASMLVSDGSANPLASLGVVVKELGQKLGVDWELKQSEGSENLHPVRQLEIYQDGKEVGLIGEVNRKVVDGLGGEERMAVAEIEI